MYAGEIMRHCKYFNFSFSYIRYEYGFEICQFLKEFCNLIKLSVNIRTRIRFLKSCINHNLVSPHLKRYTNIRNLNSFNSLSYRRLQKIQFNNVKAILQLELKDSYRHLHFIRMSIVDFSFKIHYVLPFASFSNT